MSNVGDSSKRSLSIDSWITIKKIKQHDESVLSDTSTNENLHKNESEEKEIISCSVLGRKHLYESSLSESETCLKKGKIEFSLHSSVFVNADDSKKWISLKCFDSIILKESSGAILFAGGPIQSSAFSILPHDTKINQYIAVAASNAINKNHSHNNTCSMSGIIQLWNLGSLYERRKLIQPPLMELALYHDNGILTQMKWCPANCYDLSHSTSHLPRLGLLAASSSDSSVYIYNIPQPNFMPKSNASFPIYFTLPFIKLVPLFGGPSKITKKSGATCMEWNQNGERIVAGYGNGSVCVWRINSSFTSNIAVKGTDESYIVQPYLFFQASGACIESLSFAPFSNYRWLVVSSIDKMVRFFDLDDTSTPFHSLKRGLENSCIWSEAFCGIYSSPTLDGANRLSLSGIDITAENVEKAHQKGVSGLFDASTHVAVSENRRFHAISDEAGTVTVNVLKNVRQPLITSYLTFVIFQTEVMALNKIKNLSPKGSENKIIISGDIVSNGRNLLKDSSSSSSGFCSPKHKKTIVINTSLCSENDTINLIENSPGPSISDVKDVNNNRIKTFSNKPNFNEENDELIKYPDSSGDLMHDLLMVKISNQSKSPTQRILFNFSNNFSFNDSKDAEHRSGGASITSEASGYTGDTIMYPLEEYYCDTSHSKIVNSAQLNSSSCNDYNLTSKHSKHSRKGYLDSTKSTKKTIESIDTFSSNLDAKGSSISKSGKAEFPLSKHSDDSLCHALKPKCFIRPQLLPDICSHATSSDFIICDRDGQSSVRALNQSSAAASAYSGDTILYSPRSDDCLKPGANYSSMENPAAISHSSCKSGKENTFQDTSLLNMDQEDLSRSETKLKDYSSSHSEYETDSASETCYTSYKNRSFCQKEISFSEFHQLHSEYFCDESTEKHPAVNEPPRRVTNPQKLSYENLVGSFGVIFKNNLDKSKSPLKNQRNDIYVKHNPLSVIRTISWNPNEGCDSWLFVGGNSGIGRLVFVPDFLPDTIETTHKKQPKVS